MLELGIKLLGQLLFHFFFGQFGNLFILHALDMNLCVGFLNETNLENVIAVGNDRCNLKEGCHLSGIVTEEVIHSSLNTGDKADAISHLTGTPVTDGIVNQRQIRFI